MTAPDTGARTGGKPQAPIRLRIQHVSQLFHTLDPFPFRERDLDAQVEDYVVEWARELGAARPITIAIHMPAAEARAEEASQIAEAFRNYFTARTGALSLEMRALFRGGRDALAIGLPLLAITVLLGSLLPLAIPEGFARRFLEQGLIIVGWVANWRPFEVFLFEWWPVARKRDLYRRLSEASVELAGDLDKPAPAP